MWNLKAALLIGPFLALAAAADVTMDDIRRLHGAGISEDVIVAYVNSHRPVRISAAELADLKKEGVGDKVLTVLAGTTTPYAAPAQTESTYVYPSTTYYSYPSYGYSYPYSSSYYYPRYYPSLYFSYGYPYSSHHHHGSYYRSGYHGGYHHSGGYRGHHGGHSSGGHHGGHHSGGGYHGGKR